MTDSQRNPDSLEETKAQVSALSAQVSKLDQISKNSVYGDPVRQV